MDLIELLILAAGLSPKDYAKLDKRIKELMKPTGQQTQTEPKPRT